MLLLSHRPRKMAVFNDNHFSSCSLYISPTAVSRTLVEYEIQMEHLQISSENNISKAELKFVFRRRMEFHVANTFLQTFLLTAVGSMSFYFDINNFGPKMQVTVTTMLVVATISNSIRNVRMIIKKEFYSTQLFFRIYPKPRTTR